MGRTIVGIDISAAGLRAAEVDGALKQKPVLVRYAEMPLPPGAVNKGEVVDAKTVATALKRLWAAGGFATKDVVLGVGNSRVLARELSVPRMPLGSIRESLPFHVQEMLPFPTKDALLDFYPISESSEGNGPVINGLLVAVLKSVVAGNIAAAKQAGLNTVNVDLVPFALSRVFQRGRSTGTVALIDVGANTSTVVVSASGVPQFVRIIPIGGDDLTNALASRLNMSPDTAERSKRALGLSNSGTPNDPASVMLEVTRQLLTALRDTLNYYSSSRQGVVLSRIVLTGGGGSMRGFREALSDYMHLSVSMGDPLENISIGKKADKAIRAIGADASLSVAVGLALGNAA